MGCSYEEAKVRWYISNLLLTKDVSPKVMEIVVDWAQDKADIIGFDETEMDNAGKAENPEANLRRQEILLAGLGKHPSPFGTVTKSASKKRCAKWAGFFACRQSSKKFLACLSVWGRRNIFWTWRTTCQAARVAAAKSL